MYMCKTRGLSTASLMSPSSLLCGGNDAPPVLSHTHNLEGHVTLPFRRRHEEVTAFMCLKQREQTASCVTSAHAYTYTLFIWTYIPENCTSFHSPALQVPLKASQTSFQLLSPSLVLLCSYRVYWGSNTRLCDETGPGIHVDDFFLLASSTSAWLFPWQLTWRRSYKIMARKWFQEQILTPM